MTEIENLPERLRTMQEAFNDAPVEGDKYELPEDGTYQALVNKFDFFESKKGDAYIKIVLQIAHDRSYAGREVDVIHNLEDAENGIKWLKKNLATLGADVDNFDLSQLVPGSKLLEPLLDVPVELAVVTSERQNDQGENYRNVYINKRLGDPMNGGADVLGGPRVGGKVVSSEPELPADTAGFGQTATAAGEEDPIPFRVQPRREIEIRGRNLFTGDRWIG